MEAIERYIDEFKSLLERIDCTGPAGNAMTLPTAISSACARVRAVADSGFKIMLVGNGGSASICSHMAIDFIRSAGIAAVTFNDGSMLTCMGNDFGYEHVFAKPTELFAVTGDCLIAISSSGQSKNILNAVKAAKSKGSNVITLSGFKKDNPLRGEGEINFYVPAEHYGFVEVIHQYICHAIIDNLRVNPT